MYVLESYFIRFYVFYSIEINVLSVFLRPFLSDLISKNKFYKTRDLLIKETLYISRDKKKERKDAVDIIRSLRFTTYFQIAMTALLFKLQTSAYIVGKGNKGTLVFWYNRMYTLITTVTKCRQKLNISINISIKDTSFLNNFFSV